MEFHLRSRSSLRVVAATVIALGLAGAGFVSARSASASAQDGKLALTKDGDIWTMNADGSNLTRLTTDPAIDRFPSWSPDGTKIAFVSNRTGNFDIWVMDANGANQHEVTDEVPNAAAAPSWSSNGSQIVYHVNFNTTYVINLDGTGRQFIRDNAADAGVSPHNQLTYVDQVDGGLYTIDGIGVHALANPLGQGTLDPDWSRQGDAVSFVCTSTSTFPLDNNLCSVREDGTGLVTLDVSHDRRDFSPTWSPNGKLIAFVACRQTIPATGPCHIFTVKSDGTNVRQLTTLEVTPGAAVGGVDWGPNTGG